MRREAKEEEEDFVRNHTVNAEAEFTVAVNACNKLATLAPGLPP